MSVIETVIYVLVLSPIWGAFVWFIWESFIQPLLIPKEEILNQVGKLYIDYGGEAFEQACANERQAWYDCDSFEQGRWRRVRREIMRRERKQGFKFRKVYR